jgi:hypothetical protein
MAVCSAAKQQIPILQCLVGPDRGPNERFTELEVNMLTITTSLRFQLNMERNNIQFYPQSFYLRSQLRLTWCI